jgi:hypothetical protein
MKAILVLNSIKVVKDAITMKKTLIRKSLFFLLYILSDKNSNDTRLKRSCNSIKSELNRYTKMSFR